MTRDLTQAQFIAACRRYGFEPQLFGYYKLGETPVCVHAPNAGPRRRDQLAYLLAEYEKAQEREEAEQ